MHYTSVVPCAFTIKSGDAHGMSALNADPRQLLSYLHVICIHSGAVVVGMYCCSSTAAV